MVMTAGVARQKEPNPDDISGKHVTDYDVFTSEEYGDPHPESTNSTATSRNVDRNKSRARKPNKSAAKSDNPFQRSTLKIDDEN